MNTILRTILAAGFLMVTCADSVLMRHGADPDIPDTGGVIPLHYAAFNGDIKVIEVLFECAGEDVHGRKKIKVNARDNDEDTPLHYAARRAFADAYISSNINELLYMYGADPCARNHAGDTPLHVAMTTTYSEKEEEVVRALHVKKRALISNNNVNIANNRGRTPLHLAVMVDGERCNGGDVYMTSCIGAEELIDNDFVETLLRANADPNLRDKSGCTPLHYAAETGNGATVKFLLKHGAKVTIRDNDGRLPIDYAKEYMEYYSKKCIKLDDKAHKDVVKRLKKAAKNKRNK